MSILGIAPSTSPTSLEEKQEQLRSDVSRRVDVLYLQMKGTFNQLYDLIWNNPSGLTPQESVDAFGPQAIRLFQLAGLMQDTLNTAKPNSVTQVTPMAPTFNADGTVTLAPRDPGPTDPPTAD